MKVERRVGGYTGLHQWKNYLPKIDESGDIWIWFPVYSWGFDRLITKPKNCRNCVQQWWWYGVRITKDKEIEHRWSRI